MTASMALPEASSLPDISVEKCTGILDLLFEHCGHLHGVSLRLLQTQRFKTYDDLIREVGNQLRVLADSPSAGDRAKLEAILSAHPRLGEKRTSEQSSVEQAQLHTGGSDAAAALMQCNREYEETFPGLRYV